MKTNKITFKQQCQEAKPLKSQNSSLRALNFLILYMFLVLLFVSSAFATEWFENFEDQPISNNATIYDNGSTSWNSTVISPTFAYQGIDSVLGTKALKLIDGDSLFETEYINTTNKTGLVDVSFVFAILDIKDKFDPDDELEVYIHPFGGIPVLAVSVELEDFDKEEQINKGNLISFETAYDIFSLQFYIEADHPDERIALDNILIEWLEVGETPIEVAVNTTIYNTFNTTLNNNVNVTTFINNTIVVNTGAEEFDIFDGFANFGEEQAVCPLNEGNTDRLFYIIVFILSFVFFFFAFWIDNAVIGNLASFLMIYCGFISIACASFIAFILVVLGLIGFFLSNTQLSLTRT